MKTNTLINILKMGNISVSRFLLGNYKQLGITSEEFILLIYLMNEDNNNLILDSEKIGKAIGINTSEVLNIIYSLKEKNLIDMIVNKNDNKVISEYLTLEPFYNKLSMFLIEYLNDKKNSDNSYIYELFEGEFGRTLSPMEYEIINAWLDNNINVELIKEALKEATFNGVSNLRYIDKILYEWGKKGFKNASDIKKKRETKNKDEKVELFDYNWLEDDD
jgi:DNA replication protein